MQFNLRAASGDCGRNADRAYTPDVRRVDGGAGDLRYTFESGHSVAAQYLSLWAIRRIHETTPVACRVIVTFIGTDYCLDVAIYHRCLGNKDIDDGYPIACDTPNAPSITARRGRR